MLCLFRLYLRLSNPPSLSRFFLKHVKQNTGLPSVGLKGTSHSCLHSEHTALCISLGPELNLLCPPNLRSPPNLLSPPPNRFSILVIPPITCYGSRLLCHFLMVYNPMYLRECVQVSEIFHYPTNHNVYYVFYIESKP